MESTDGYHIPTISWGNTGRKTGFWAGGSLPLPTTFFQGCRSRDHARVPRRAARPPASTPRSNEPQFRTDLTRRFRGTTRLAGKAQLEQDRSPSTASGREGLRHRLLPGLATARCGISPEDKHSIKLIRGSFLAAGKPIAIVCHSTGCAASRPRRRTASFWCRARKFTGFTNGEGKRRSALTKSGPFFLSKTRMLKLGAIFSKEGQLGGITWSAMGLLITGTESTFLRLGRENSDGGHWKAKGQTDCHRSGFIDRISSCLRRVAVARDRGGPEETNVRIITGGVAANGRTPPNRSVKLCFVRLSAAIAVMSLLSSFAPGGRCNG